MNPWPLPYQGSALPLRHKGINLFLDQGSCCYLAHLPILNWLCGSLPQRHQSFFRPREFFATLPTCQYSIGARVPATKASIFFRPREFFATLPTCQYSIGCAGPCHKGINLFFRPRKVTYPPCQSQLVSAKPCTKVCLCPSNNI